MGKGTKRNGEERKKAEAAKKEKKVPPGKSGAAGLAGYLHANYRSRTKKVERTNQSQSKSGVPEEIQSNPSTTLRLPLPRKKKAREGQPSQIRSTTRCL
jgi:hypothetical protein